MLRGPMAVPAVEVGPGGPEGTAVPVAPVVPAVRSRSSCRRISRSWRGSWTAAHLGDAAGPVGRPARVVPVERGAPAPLLMVVAVGMGLLDRLGVTEPRDRMGRPGLLGCDLA